MEEYLTHPESGGFLSGENGSDGLRALDDKEDIKIGSWAVVVVVSILDLHLRLGWVGRCVIHCVHGGEGETKASWACAGFFEALFFALRK